MMARCEAWCFAGARVGAQSDVVRNSLVTTRKPLRFRACSHAEHWQETVVRYDFPDAVDAFAACHRSSGPFCRGLRCTVKRRWRSRVRCAVSIPVTVGKPDQHRVRCAVTDPSTDCTGRYPVNVLTASPAPSDSTTQPPLPQGGVPTIDRPATISNDANGSLIEVQVGDVIEVNLNAVGPACWLPPTHAPGNLQRISTAGGRQLPASTCDTGSSEAQTMI